MYTVFDWRRCGFASFSPSTTSCSSLINFSKKLGCAIILKHYVEYLGPGMGSTGLRLIRTDRADERHFRRDVRCEIMSSSTNYCLTFEQMMMRHIVIRILRTHEIRRHPHPELRRRTLSKLQWVEFAEVLSGGVKNLGI